MEAIKARMPWGFGRAITMARDISIAVHSKPDKWGSSVPRVEREKPNPISIRCITKQIQNNQINVILSYLWRSVIKPDAQTSLISKR